MNFAELENRDGVRFSWNILPTTRIDEKRLTIPIGAVYSPLRPLNNLGVVQYKPVICTTTNCGALLNPYCAVNYHTKVWVCPFCSARSNLPPHYAEITQENRPAEIIEQYTTLEYILDSTNQRPPAFVFVVDISLIQEELTALKKSISQALLLLPPTAEVGLITFGRDIHVYDLSVDEIVRSVTLRGTKNYDLAEVRRLLSLNQPLSTTTGIGGGGMGGGIPPYGTTEQKHTYEQGHGQHGQHGQPGLLPNMRPQQQHHRSKYVGPLSQYEIAINAALDDLIPDAWTYKATEERPDRCTGSALAVAVHLLSETHSKNNARILTFLGGPPSTGQGAIVSKFLKDSIRSHHDIQRDEAPLYEAAKTFYNNIANTAVSNNHVIDLFACSLDQVGVAEMASLVSSTGGNIVLDDSFTRGVFQGSLRRLFVVDPDDENSLVMAFGCEIQILTSASIKIQGAVGHATSLNRMSHCVSDQTIGVGKTCAWKVGGVDHNSSLVFFFEHSNDQKEKDKIQQIQGQLQQGQQQQVYFQIVAKYRHSSGRTHLRVTTIAKSLVDMTTPAGLSYIKSGFDQEAAAVVMTRLGLYKIQHQSERAIEVLRWIDRSLIRLSSKFGVYNQGDPASFRLSQEMQFFPQFMFYLRRSQFLQIFNSSPDETAFYRLVALKENTTNTVVMIQPTLTGYSLNTPTSPVMLDTSALSTDRILLLDTYFHIVIWYGGSIVAWKAQNMHLLPENAMFAQLLQAPVTDAKALMERRFPTPRFIECVEGGSQERFLIAKLNPPGPKTNAAEYSASEHPVFSEDVSLKVFLQHLKKLAVTEGNK